MSESKYTPGPWTAHLHTGKMEGEAHINADGACIAYVGFGTETERHYVTGDEAKANARLIAATPDLLSELQKALPYVERVAATSPTEPARVRKQREAAKLGASIRSAIAKATGEYK